VAIEVQIVGGPSWIDVAIAVGTIGAAVAAAWAAWVATRQNQRMMRRSLRFKQDRIRVLGPSAATTTMIVTNDSFRAITVKDVGFKYAGSGRLDVIVSAFGGDALEGPTLPITLQDGESAEWAFNANDLMQPLGTKRALMQMAALDSRGVEYTEWVSHEPLKRIRMRIEEWRGQRRQTKQIRKQYDEMWAERNGQAG
jgi:hypothetical protein